MEVDAPSHSQRYYEGGERDKEIISVVKKSKSRAGSLSGARDSHT